MAKSQIQNTDLNTWKIKGVPHPLNTMSKKQLQVALDICSRSTKYEDLRIENSLKRALNASNAVQSFFTNRRTTIILERNNPKARITVRD